MKIKQLLKEEAAPKAIPVGSRAIICNTYMNCKSCGKAWYEKVEYTVDIIWKSDRIDNIEFTANVGCKACGGTVDVTGKTGRIAPTKVEISKDMFGDKIMAAMDVDVG